MEMEIYFYTTRSVSLAESWSRDSENKAEQAAVRAAASACGVVVGHENDGAWEIRITADLASVRGAAASHILNWIGHKTAHADVSLGAEYFISDVKVKSLCDALGAFPGHHLGTDWLSHQHPSYEVDTPRWTDGDGDEDDGAVIEELRNTFLGLERVLRAALRNKSNYADFRFSVEM